MQLARDRRNGQKFAVKYILRGEDFDIRTISCELMNQVGSNIAIGNADSTCVEHRQINIDVLATSGVVVDGRLHA